MSQNDYWQQFMQRRWSRRRLLQAGVVTGAGLWAGSTLGCSSSTTPTATAPAATAPSGVGTTPQPGATPKPAASPQTQIQKGGKLRFAFGSDAGTLDPALGSSGYDDWFWYAMFDNLAAFDQSYISKPELSLAQQWEFPDPTTMVFKLRQGVKFHDGTPFNAQAVKYNIERILDPAVKANPRSQLLVISKVDVVDDYTVRLNLSKPSAPLLPNLGWRGGAMCSPAALEKYGDTFGVHPVGTGPFQFVEYVKGSYLAAKRFPDYWGKDAAGNQLPYLDGVRIMIIPDSTVALANLQTGDADIVGIQAKDLDTVKKNKNLALENVSRGGVANQLTFNVAKPPMDDVNLRLAVAYAVDPEAINNAVYFGDGTVAKGGMWPPGSWAYNETVPRPSYDPKKAKEYLAKAGKPNGFSMTMTTYNVSTVQQTAEMVKAQLAEVGIKVDLDVRDVSQATNSFYTDQATPIFCNAWSYRPEPDSVSAGCYRSDGFYNPAKVKNAELDALVDKGAATYDINERKKIYDQINTIVLGQAYILPLIYANLHEGYNVKVQNMGTFFGGDGKGRYKEIWIKQ